MIEPPVLKTLKSISGYTHNELFKMIVMVHPHWYEGSKGYKLFIKAMKETIELMPGYLFNITGLCSYKGVRLLECIEQHLKRNDNVQSVKLEFRNNHSLYTLIIKVKDE